MTSAAFPTSFPEPYMVSRSQGVPVLSSDAATGFLPYATPVLTRELRFPAGPSREMCRTVTSGRPSSIQGTVRSFVAHGTAGSSIWRLVDLWLILSTHASAATRFESGTIECLWCLVNQAHLLRRPVNEQHIQFSEDDLCIPSVCADSRCVGRRTGQ